RQGPQGAFGARARRRARRGGCVCEAVPARAGARRAAVRVAAREADERARSAGADAASARAARLERKSDAACAQALVRHASVTQWRGLARGPRAARARVIV